MAIMIKMESDNLLVKNITRTQAGADPANNL